jgi:hypothetical protein
MMCIPNMLNAGNRMGTIKKAFSDVVKSKFGKEKMASLFIRYAIKVSAIAARLNEINSGIVDNGDR